MLAIRMQRRGRKGHAQFRVIVQESRLSPSSGRVVASLGNYDPHTKEVSLDTEKATFYLTNGAQPSNAVAKLFEREKLKMPDWVVIDRHQDRSIKDAKKLRKNAPAEEEAPAEEAADVPVAEEPSADDAPEEAPEEEAKAEEKPAEEKADPPAEEKAEKDA